MENNGFVENGFIVDLSNEKDAAGVVYELSNILDMPEAKDKEICLKLGKIDLTQSQLLSIKSLITSMSSELAFVDTNSEKTEMSALNLGIIISELKNEIKVEEAETEDAEIKEMEVGEPKDGLSYSLDLGIPQNNEPEKEVEIFELETIENNNTQPNSEEKLEELIDEEHSKLNNRELMEEEISKFPTLYLKQTLRSGQTMSYDGNVVLIGNAHPGSEIIAKGDITVWGILGGIAHAGARGNDFATIKALRINAIQLRISGYYARRPDSANIPYIQRTNEFTPEEAKVDGGAIAVYKMDEIN